MFTRRAFHHPYKPSARISPAGFRIVDYINPKCFNLFQGLDVTTTVSPGPSPLNSPLKDSCHPQQHLPLPIRLADFFGTPQCPPTPAAPDHPLNATPNLKKANVPAKDASPIPPRRKNKYGPKRLSFDNVPLRPGVLPPRRRAQQLKEKRDAVRRRILDRYERRTLRAREAISNLHREAEALMTPEHMNAEDMIFLKQLGALQLDQALQHDLEECRQRISRAADELANRKQEHKQRDREAVKMWGVVQDKEAQQEQQRKMDAFLREKEERRVARYRRMEAAAIRADEKRRRAHERRERKIREEQERLFREELARKAQEEEERRRQEEQERQLREERERQIRERERQRQEALEQMLREEVERLRKEAHEQFLRKQRERFAREEQERQAHLLAEQARRAARKAAREEQIRQHFVVYEGKWNELRTSDSLPPINVQQVPWPVFGVVSSADQITYQEVRAFLFHPQRLSSAEGKSDRDKVKSEVLRFHPDKFNTRIVPKVQPSQQAVAQEIAGAVARILTRIMTEDVKEQS